MSKLMIPAPPSFKFCTHLDCACARVHQTEEVAKLSLYLGHQITVVF